MHYSNWSGLHNWQPKVNINAATELDLVAAVQTATAQNLKLRAIGSGHSFTEVAVSTGVQVDLANLNQVIAADSSTGIVTVGAGITVKQLAIELNKLGLALPNQGDIDQQTIAGAISTGTHGTGLGYGNISSAVVGMKIIDANGKVHQISQDTPELLQAARVSVGALGVISEVTLQTVPSFRIHRRSRKIKVEQVLENLTDYSSNNDHFEFFCLPYAKDCLILESTRTQEPPLPFNKYTRYINDELLENQALGMLMKLAKVHPKAAPVAAKIMAACIGSDERRDESYRVYANDRKVRFNEMEYAVKLTDLPQVVAEVLALISRNKYQVAFPIEVRVGPADQESILSTSTSRATGYVAVHQLAGMEFRKYFDAVETIMANYQGRPHWGKLHSLAAADFEKLYPQWHDFTRIRKDFDPTGIFLNPHLERVFI